MTLHATVSKPDGKYHVQVSDGTNTSDDDPNVGSGHDAALEGLANHRKAFGEAKDASVAITIEAGAV